MIISIIKRVLYFLIVLSVILNLNGCCPDESGKIPISTSSCEAKENYIKGRGLAENLQNQEALIFFEKAIEQDSNFAMAYFGAAMAQPEAGQLFEYLNKSESLIDNVSEGERLIILGAQAGVNRDYDKQLENYRLLAEKYPNDEYALYQRGNFYFSQQQYQEAIKCYKNIIKINKNFAPVYNQLGYSYRNIEKFDTAEKAFKKYIQLIPDNPNPYDSYGELLLKMGEYEASIEQYEKALRQDSNFVASCIGIASNLIYISEYDEARLLMERYYNRARNNAERRRALTARAITFVDEGDFKSAIKELEKIINEFKKDNDDVAVANALALIGAIQFESEKYDLALNYFSKALKIIENSNLPDEVKKNTGFTFLFGETVIHAKKKKFQSALSKAEQFMTEAQRINNLNQIRNGHEIYGIIALEMEEYKKSITELNQSNLQNPYNLFRIALAYEKMGDVENAKLFLKKTVNFNSFLNFNYSFCRHMAKNKLIDLQ
jgi:tetratricopeptide (TPR) repeat protein